MGMIKDGRSQRWSLADNLGADAANGKKAAHDGHNGEPKGLRQGYGRIGYPGRGAPRSGALQTRDRHECWRLERSRLSGAPLRKSFALHRSRDTGLAQFS